MPLVNVAIFINIAPLFTVLLAIPILGEKFSAFKVISGVVSFIGVLLIVLGRIGSDTDEYNTEMVYWLILLPTPLIISLGDFKTSKILQLGVASFFLPWWSNNFQIIIGSTILLFTQPEVPTSYMFWFLTAVVGSLISQIAW